MHPHISNRFYLRGAGALLLMLPLSANSIRLLRAPVQAQAGRAARLRSTPDSLSSDKKAAIKRVLGLSKQGRVCKNLIDLKLDGASLEEVVAGVKRMLPSASLIVAVRSAQPVSVSLDLKQTRVGDVLSHVAALAGCKLFVRANGLIIAPQTQLTEFELKDFRERRGGDWLQCTEAGGGKWAINSRGNQLFTEAIAKEVAGTGSPSGLIKTTFGKFSPDSQAILREMVASLNEKPSANPRQQPLHLNASSAVHIEISAPQTVSVRFPSTQANR
ncbi:hypothetical protein EON83_27315 [bacterium]|nr:MAG: hypothetical protein EON83_27315 [bacterium]